MSLAAMLPYSQMNFSTVCLLFLTVHITVELGIRDRDRVMFSTSLHFAYSFQDEKMSRYIATFSSCLDVQLSHILLFPLCLVLLSWAIMVSGDRWEKLAYNKVAILGDASKGFSILD